MSDFGSINIAYTGLNAHRKRLNVIGENIANINTPGYNRQRVQLSPIPNLTHGPLSGASRPGGGVNVDEVVRLRNQTLSSHARSQGGVAAGRLTAAQALQQLEQVVGGLDAGGLHDQMTALFNSFDDLASAPDDPAMRRVVLQRAETVAQGFSRTSTAMDQQRARAEADTIDSVRSLNLLASQIAELDAEILGSVTVDAEPNALMDKRDRMVDELAQLADVDVIEHSNGQVTISLDGQLLVSNGGAIAISVGTQVDAGLTPLGYARITIESPNGRELNLGGGELAGHLGALNQTIPDGRRDLDAVIADLTSQVNALHQGGVGLDGSTGLDFFEVGPGSGQLQVSADVADQPDKVAAAAAGFGILDNGNAMALAQLSESPTGPVARFAEMVGTLAARVNTAVGSSEAADAASDQATNLALAAGGVSLDEELTDLITAQRSYEASARLMTAIDEMLQTLVTSTGLVGR